VRQFQVSFTSGNNYASSVPCRISRKYIQLMYARILHHYGTLKILKRWICIIIKKDLASLYFILNDINFACFTFQEWHEENTNTLITYLLILTSMIFNIFIFCYIGDLVTEQVKYIFEFDLSSHFIDFHCFIYYNI